MPPKIVVDQLKADLEERGVVHLEFDSNSNPIDGSIRRCIDSFVHRLGFRGLAKDWYEITSENAADLVAAILHRDMAYSSEEMPFERAVSSAGQITALVVGARYFSNTDEIPGRKNAWSFNPITGSTFDTGIVMVGLGEIGILWIEDED